MCRVRLYVLVIGKLFKKYVKDGVFGVILEC